MGLYSRNRGKRGERLWCSFCREQGYDVHRTAQYRGNTGAAGDVEGLPYIHCEVKYVQALNIAKAMEQSDHDTKAMLLMSGKMTPELVKAWETGEHFETSQVILPIVASKRAKEDWLVTMYAWHFVTLISSLDNDTLDNLTVIHKPSKRFSVRKFLHEAACMESDEGRIVAVKYPRGDNASLVTMYAEDWFTLYREWEAGMDLKRRAEREEH